MPAFSFVVFVLPYIYFMNVLRHPSLTLSDHLCFIRLLRNSKGEGFTFLEIPPVGLIHRYFGPSFFNDLEVLIACTMVFHYGLWFLYTSSWYLMLILEICSCLQLSFKEINYSSSSVLSLGISGELFMVKCDSRIISVCCFVMTCCLE